MKKKLLYGELFFLNSNCQKNTVTSPLRDILVACRGTSSLPEQVKLKENLCEHNIQLKNLTMFKKRTVGFIIKFVRS